MTPVLFGQSYYLCFDPKLCAAMQPYPPLGTLYAASYLRARGYAVALYDAMLARGEEEWAHALEHEKPRLAVIYEDNFNYLSKMCLLRMRQAALAMTEMARARGCTVVVGGADATDHPELYLQHGAHFCMLGEGEYTLGELTDYILQGIGTPKSILGLSWVDSETGRVVHTPRRPDIIDLDRLPFPAWDLVDVTRYRELWHRRHSYYSMNMVTTRGCPYHCNWCAKPIWGQRCSVRSPENVVAELKWLKETYSPDHIWFADDIMGIEPGWLERFADLLERNHLRVPFKSLHRVDLLLKGETIPALKRAGAQTVWVGAESGSQAILDAMEKGTRVEQIDQAARRLHAAGMQVGFFLQFGYPGETREDIAKTLQMVRDCRPDDIGISISYPLPGTTFYARVKDQLSARQNWLDSNDLAMLYHGPFTTAFYRQLHIVVHKEFRIRKAWDEWLHARQRDSSRTPRRTSQWRLLCALLYRLLTLPLARLKLEWLARRPHRGLAPLGPVLSSEATAHSSLRTDR